MKQYVGGCHCGSIRFTVDMDIEEVLSCNCSICSRRGHLLAFTSEDNFHLQKGKDFLTDYQFREKNIHHLFCKVCGIASFGKGSMPDGTRMVSINVRCLDGVDFEKFPVKNFDGRSL